MKLIKTILFLTVGLPIIAILMMMFTVVSVNVMFWFGS